MELFLSSGHLEMLKLNGLPQMNILQPPLQGEMGSLFLMHAAVLKARDMFLWEMPLYLEIQRNFMHIYLLRIMPARLV